MTKAEYFEQIKPYVKNCPCWNMTNLDLTIVHHNDGSWSWDAYGRGKDGNPEHVDEFITPEDFDKFINEIK